MKEFIEKLIGRLEKKKSEHLNDEKVMQEIGKKKAANFCSGNAWAIDGVIEIVNQLAEEYKPCHKPCTDCKDYDLVRNHCPKFCNVIKETVKEIEKNSNGWIPCGERLPEEEGYYLITILFYHLNKPVVMGCNFEDGQWWNIDKEDEITAWMPLPEPYKEEGAE